jgi:hypothetical protein
MFFWAFIYLLLKSYPWFLVSSFFISSYSLYTFVMLSFLICFLSLISSLAFLLLLSFYFVSFFSFFTFHFSFYILHFTLPVFLSFFCFFNLSIRFGRKHSNERMKLPTALAELLEDPNILKVGCNILNDRTKLFDDYDYD